jgi:hypothetical protein
MATKKTTGKKLADMMYGNPEGAAFGITPFIGKRREDRQDREAAKNFPVDLGRGAIAGALGVFGDMESLGRLPYELYTGNESPTFLPTSEDVLKRIPFGSDSPTGQFASGLGILGGGSLPLGPAYRGVKALPGALKTVARNVSAPRTLDPQAGVFRLSTPKKPDPVVGTRYKKQFMGGLAPRKDLDIENLEKSSVKIFPHDATSRNYSVTEVSDIPLTNPVLTEGGDDYMRDLQHMKQRIATASNPGIAKRIQKRVDQAAIENQLLGGTGKVYGFPIRMGDLSERAATFPTDIAMDLLMQGGLNKREMAALTKDLRTMAFEGKGRGYFKNVAPIGSPEFLVQLREGVKADKDKGISAVTDMNLRKGLMDRLALVDNQKRLGFNIQDLTNSVLADELKGVPKGYVGNVAAELDPFTATRPSKSSTYGMDIGGLYEGSMPNMPVEFLTPNTFEGLYREMKTLYPKATPEALRNMTIGAMEKRNEGISEMIGPRSVDAVKTFQEGLKQGEFDPNNITEVYDYMRRKKLGLELAAGGSVSFSDNPDVMQFELSGGGLVKRFAKTIGKAAESAGQKAPVLADKDLTTLQDAHTNLGDRVRAGAMEAQKMMEGFGYQYDKGQRVFTKDSAGKNKPPYTILNRTRVGNQVMREDHPEFGPGMGKPIIDPQTGKTMRTPYEPGYRVRMERGPDDWSEFEIPEKAIVGDVEMASGGAVRKAAGGEITADDLILEERKL